MTLNTSVVMTSKEKLDIPHMQHNMSPVQKIPPRFRASLLSLVVHCMQNTYADLQVRCVISFDGRIDAERMATAARLTLDAEPILGCRLVNHWWRPYWERRTDLDRVEVCTLIEVGDLDRAILDFMTAPIDPLTDPLAQVRIIRSDRDLLCIKMDHMVADAYAMKEYAYLLASIYQKLAQDPRYVPVPNLSDCRSLRQVSQGLRFSDMLRIIRRGCRDFKRRFSPPVFWRFPSRKSHPAHKTFAVRHLNPGKFRALKDYGKKHQATLSDIMVTAFCRALFKCINPGQSVPLRVSNTVDLRRHLPSDKKATLCTFSNFFYLNIGHDIGSTFDETLVSVRNETKTLKADYLGLGDIPLAALIFHVLPFSWARGLFIQQLNLMIRQGNAPPIFTNQGDISSEKLSFGDVQVRDAYIIGATFIPPFFGMALSGFGESLTLSISFFETAIERSTVERFLGQIEAELPV